MFKCKIISSLRTDRTGMIFQVVEKSSASGDPGPMRSSFSKGSSSKGKGKRMEEMRPGIVVGYPNWKYMNSLPWTEKHPILCHILSMFLLTLGRCRRTPADEQHHIKAQDRDRAQAAPLGQRSKRWHHCWWLILKTSRWELRNQMFQVVFRSFGGN